MSGKTQLLFVGETYDPGWKGGGPVQSLNNLVGLLRNSFDISVMTRNHDHLETQPYPGIPSDTWIERDGVRAFYMDDSSFSQMTLNRAYSDVMPDTMYLASIMSGFTRRFLTLSTARLIHPTRIVVAPQGEMSSAAKSNKPIRKWGYLTIAQILGAFSRVIWHASAAHEADDIRRTIRHPYKISTIPDVAKPPIDSSPPRSKQAGAAAFVSVARISPIKNVLWLVRLFERVEGAVTLRLVGPREPDYWRAVADAINLLPPNVTVDYMGPIPPSAVPQVLLDSDFFILPTLGENFGHAIYESLSVGRPVLISDRTPWSVVESRNAGWVMDPTDADTWAESIAHAVSMKPDEYLDLSHAALGLAQEWYASQDYHKRYQQLLGS